jgi:hypothetical protein
VRSNFSKTVWLTASVTVLAGATVVACGLTPSRAPLGGDYTPPEVASATPRKAPEATPHANDDDTAANEAAAQKPSTLAALPGNALDGGVAPDASDTLRYDPLKAGDQIRADVSFSVSAELQGDSSELRGSNNKIRLEAKIHVDLKILKSSAQSLDELELTLTPVSMHTEIDGQTSDSAQDPAETFDVTLSGQTPNIRTKSGAVLEKEDRATLTVLITPLIEFHNHWLHSPSLSLTPGWSSKVPISTPAFMAAPGDTVHVGPLTVRYAGREGRSKNAPFELSLPVEWSSDIGKLNFDFSGRTMLSADKGRPLSLELSGTLNGNGGGSAGAAQMGLRGTAKFSATLSYP